MNRPTGLTIAAVLTFSGAMILALASCAFFVVGVMVITGDGGRAPVSEAIAGMALAGAFMLLILALAAACVALNARELRDWARTISLAEIATDTKERLLSIFASIAAVRGTWFTDFVSSHKSRRIEHHL
ncbi:MAG: hypothetical protein WCC97_13100 [Candidatus Acidiferrales bacterium]